MSIPNRVAIQKAHKRIKSYIHKTPVLQSTAINAIAGATIFFKCENFQKIGAFKIRGGINAALSLPPTEMAKGLATHSSGNHAQAIALAAKLLGVKAYIVMPSNSPSVKIDAVRGYGAEVTLCEPTLASRETTLQSVVERTGAAFIHPYDDARVIAGAATSAKELIAQVPDLQIVMAPVGGGGLLSGTALSAHYFGKNIEVIAGEPEGAADAILSFKSGQLQKAPYIKTIADGLLTNLSDLTFNIIKTHVSDILTVNDTEILAVMRLIYERMKIVIEPSCAVPLAALLKNKAHFQGKRVGIILSGGNVDLGRFGEWFG